MNLFAIRHRETAWSLSGQHTGTRGGHVRRVLVARWIGLPAEASQHFLA